MSPSVRALGLLNRLFDKFVMLLALLLVFFAAFNIWDNNQLYMAVDTVQAALMSLKPSTTQGTETDGIIDYSNENDLFGQLKAINPDIRAWLTVDGTSIDFPVLQGEDNFHYLNRDPYGNFAVAGSVFMDYRCDKDMEGNYLLMYAHHMGQGKMFGDLDQFEKAEFFKENTTGTLITPLRNLQLGNPRSHDCLRFGFSHLRPRTLSGGSPRGCTARKGMCRQPERRGSEPLRGGTGGLQDSLHDHLFLPVHRRTNGRHGDS